MYRRGCPWDEFVYVAAARGRHMGCIEFARENHCDWTSHMTYAAAGDYWFGSDFLAWAFGWEEDDDECEPPWTVDERTGQRSQLWPPERSEVGSRTRVSVWRLHRVRRRRRRLRQPRAYFKRRENPAIGSSNERTCALAALEGHFEILRWAHEHGCRWSSSTSAAAAFGREHGDADLGIRPRVSVGRVGLRGGSRGGHLEILQVASQARLRLGFENVRGGSRWRPSRYSEVGTQEQVPVGRTRRAPRRPKWVIWTS